MATVMPAMPVYEKVLRFSSFIVGTIATVLPIIGLIIRPAFGAIADKFRCHRAVLIIWEVIMLLGFFCVQFIPIPDVPSSSQMSPPIEFMNACTSFDKAPYFEAKVYGCTWVSYISTETCNQWNLTSADCVGPINDGNIIQTICLPVLHKHLNATPSPHWNITCPPGRTAHYDSADNAMDDADTIKTWQFWVFTMLLLGTSAGAAVVSTLTDTICIEICGDASLYGRQRVWSSITWAFLAIVNGFIIDAVSVDGEEKNYTPAFYIMLVPLLIDLVVSYNLKFDLPEPSKSIGKDLWKMAREPRTMIFMFWCFMVGVSFGLLWNFLFWLLEDLASAAGSDVTAHIKTIEGLVTGIQSFLGEAPSFIFGGTIINKFGHGHAISLVLFFVGLRFTLYSILVNPWWCLPIEILQTDYGLFYSTMTSYAKKVSLPGTEATIQSVMCSLCEGVGVALGSFVGGLLYQQYGGNMAFRIFGIGYMVMAVINEIIEFLLKRILKQEMNQNPPDLKIVN